MSSLGLSTDSDLRPLGIGAFQGDSSLENQSASVPSSSNPDLVTSSSPSSAVDSLEFLEFMSKNSIEIIPYDQFTLERGIKDGSSGDSKTPALELKGANMQVIKARWNDEIVALKVFQAISTPGVGSTAYGMVERIQQYKNLMQDIRYEIQVMNQSRRNPHRNILNLLGVSFEEGSAVSENGAYIERYFRPILVTPHAHETYPDLRHYLRYQNRPRPLPYDECVRLIGDIADGIHGLHHVGVVHADLKPENILIFPFDGSPDRDIVAKVADFGFSGLKVSDTGVPRGGTRVWNAPECLRGCADEHLLRQSGEVTRDTYSFGLVMVHIMLDGGEPLPFGDHEALDEMKLNDEAREEALGRLRKYYLAQRGNAEPHELERLEQVINETILRDPSKRRKTLEKVRSELIGGYVYSRELEIMRMTMGNRYPALVAMKHSDPLYEVANAVSAIQGAAKRLPFSLRNSILQDYLTRKLDDEPWETRMRLLGLVSQELREVHPRYTNQIRKPDYFQTRFCEVYDKPTESTRKTATEIEALHQLEKRLLHQYSEYRNPELRIRGYLKDILEEFQDLQEFFISGGKVGVLLEKPRQGDQSMIVPSFQTVLNLKTKSGFGVLHCAAYHDNFNFIRCLLEPGSEYQVNGKAGTAGYTALHIAAARGNIASIRALLEGGADPNMASSGELGCHLTPLALLVLWCSDSERLSGAVKVLAGYEADFSRTIGGRLTLAHMAAGRPTSKCLREILFYVPGLSNVPDVYHRTPLHVAAEEGRLENVQLLLQLGANPNQIDYEGKTPLDLAKTTNTDNDRGFTLGIGSDFSYGLLRNQFTAVSREEYGAVIDYLGKSMEADRGKTTAHEQKGVEAQVGLSKSKSNMVLDSRGPTFKFAVADALRIPRGVLELPLPDALPLKPKGFFLVRHAHYVVFEPRYGLRCIYSVIEDVPSLNYQLLLRLCRLKHEWNNFPLTLRVLKLPERELLFSHRWLSSTCLPQEDRIYTVKFGEFLLLEAASIEISLLTEEIGSDSLPSAGLAFNWISIEPHTPDVPVYGIMDSTEIGLEDTQSIVDYEPVDYSITDESNYVDFGYTNYY